VSVEVRTVTANPSLPRLFAKAALSQRGRRGELPAYSLHRPRVTVDRDHLLSYQRICRFTGGDVLPHTYPHVVGFPLQVQLMADRSFPLPLPGLVHLVNQITVHRRLTADDELDLTVGAEALRPHPRGTLVDLVTAVTVDGEVAWEGRSTYLRRRAGDSAAPQGQPAPQAPEGPPVGVIRVDKGAGRAYAAVSGDVNPIHLHAWSAKAMGFPRAIAHGMWTCARALAVLGEVSAHPSTSHVWFQKPVLLPSVMEVLVADQGLETLVALRSAKDGSKQHLAMTVSHD
jgi:acyl dehydratase